MSPAPLRVTGWFPSSGPARMLALALALVALAGAAVVAADSRGRAARHVRAAEALTRLELSAETLKIIGDRYEDGGRFDAGNVRAGTHAWALMEREIGVLERRPHPEAPHAGFRGAIEAWRAAGGAIARSMQERDAAAARRIADRQLIPSITVLQRHSRELAVAHTAAAADLRLRATITALLGVVLVVGVIAARVVAVRRRAEGDALERRADARLRALLDQVDDVVCVLDADGRVTWIASSLQRLLGFAPEAVLGRPLTELIHAEDRSTAAAIASWTAVPGDGGRVLLRLEHADGRPRHVEVVGANHLEDPVLGGLVLSLRDVGERVRLEAAVRHQAFHDPLTGLANRSLFEDRLGVALAGRGQGPAVLFLDIDDFKQINDALGHAMGDELLRAVADRLRSVVREGDTAARVGGDEFALVLADADQDAAAGIGARLLDALALPVTVADRWLSVSGSIGVAVADPGGDSVPSLLQAADVAMYAAKNGGKRRMEVFSPAMRAGGLGRPQLVASLREAIEGGGLSMRFRPVVEIDSGRTVAAEALVHWRHPVAGECPPSDLRRLAEEGGLGAALGEWLLRAACREAAAWPATAGAPLPVGVRAGAAQLADPAFADRVGRALRDSGLDAHRLTLMVSDEGAGARSVSPGALEDLRDLGVTFTVDGFTAGRSLLTSATELPVAAIRLTGAVVGDLDSRPASGRLVRGIVELGRTLGVPVVVDGIERPAQRAALLALGADFGQGPLYSAALTGAEVAERLTSEAASASTASTTLLRAAGSPSSTPVTRVGSDAAGASATRPSSTPE